MCGAQTLTFVAEFPAFQRPSGRQRITSVCSVIWGRLRRKCDLIRSINDRREGTHQGEGESIPGIAQSGECTDERGDMLPHVGAGSLIVGE